MTIRGILVSSLLAVTYRVFEINWILIRSQFSSLNALSRFLVHTIIAVGTFVAYCIGFGFYVDFFRSMVIPTPPIRSAILCSICRSLSKRMIE